MHILYLDTCTLRPSITPSHPNALALCACCTTFVLAAYYYVYGMSVNPGGGWLSSPEWEETYTEFDSEETL